jgi:hypothetical protein
MLQKVVYWRHHHCMKTRLPSILLFLILTIARRRVSRYARFYFSITHLTV